MALQKYLSTYAEPESRSLGHFEGLYDHVLCIPAYAEDHAFLTSCLRNISTQKLLVIVVVNAPDTAAEEKINQTESLLSALEANFPLKQVHGDNLSLREVNLSTDLLLIQRCKPGFFLNKRGGVGLARKIACDIACHLIHEGVISTPWIHTTDADAILPPGYFDGTKDLAPALCAAAIYPFRHVHERDDRLKFAQQLYDASLDYYVHGLFWASSPWAFHTIGSTLVINSFHYAQARGFPKREAGEDFYLLNKLGKTGKICQLECEPVFLTSRQSDRVPFGTGPAINKIMGMQEPAHEFRLYNPTCFVYLKAWHDLYRYLWQERKTELTEDFVNKHASDIDAKILINCLSAMGVKKFLSHALGHSTTEEIFLRHLHNWFDAFVTLKAIHWWRDHHFPSQTLEQIRQLDALPFTQALGNIPSSIQKS